MRRDRRMFFCTRDNLRVLHLTRVLRPAANRRSAAAALKTLAAPRGVVSARWLRGTRRSQNPWRSQNLSRVPEESACSASSACSAFCREPPEERQGAAGLLSRRARIVRTTKPEQIALAASTRRPSRKSPDTSCTHPIRYGPTKPPRFPTELIKRDSRRRAVAAQERRGQRPERWRRAVEPDRTERQRREREGWHGRERARREAHGGNDRARGDVQPPLARPIGVRGDRDHADRGDEKRHGGHRPTARSDAPDNRLTICGRKKLKP